MNRLPSLPALIDRPRLLCPAILALAFWTLPAQGCGPYCDMMGGDKAAYYIHDAGTCEAACDRAGDCRGWTWVKPGVQGPQAVCYLKNQLLPARRSDCCISGYRGDRSAAASMRQFRFDVGQKETLPPAPGPAASPAWSGTQGAAPGRRAHCFCTDAQGRRYEPVDLYGQGYCHENAAKNYNCQ